MGEWANHDHGYDDGEPATTAQHVEFFAWCLLGLVLLAALAYGAGTVIVILRSPVG